jgi:predicted dehydrogenase
VLRWGFLGASRIGKRALAPAVLAAGHGLVAVGARDRDRAAAFAAEFGAPHAYASYAEVIADPDVDAVYVALPNDAHAPWTIRALEAGKHVLCEKPLALNAAEVGAIRDAEARTGRRAMEAFCHIFHPRYARVRELLAGGELGGLVAMQCHFGATLPEWPNEFRWSGGQGGGAAYDLGCYCVSAMRVLTGQEPLRVAAVPRPRGEVDESLSALLDFGAGLAGGFACSFASAATQQLVLLGSEKQLRMDWPFSQKGRDTRLELGDRVENFSMVDPYAIMVSHFAQAVLGHTEMLFGVDWSLAQARTIDALLAASASARTEAV